MNIKLLEEQNEKIKELYTSGLSTAKIGTILDISAESIRNRLHKIGVKVRTREEACTKYKIDSSFFNSINTEEKAYWLGFITADGGIVKNELVLSLKKSDTQHIELFQKSIKSTHPIKIITHIIKGKKIKQPRLVISSIAIVRSLKNLGVGERKSFTVKPAILPDNLQTAYWRGYFDGDGHINFSSDFRVTELTGNKYMLKGFANFIKKEINTFSKIEKHKNVYRIRHSKRSYVFLIAKLLYSSSNIHLARKYNVAKAIFQDIFFQLRKNSKLRVLQVNPMS